MRFSPAILLLALCPAAFAAEPAGARKCAVTVSGQRFGGAGTCVGYDKATDTSWVVTCNHIFSERHDPRGGFADDVYPQKCQIVLTNSLKPGSRVEGKRLDAVAVAGDRDSDLALVRVKGEIPHAEVAKAVPAPGGKLWRFGNGSGAVETSVSKMQSAIAAPRFALRAEGIAVSGDSGAGYFDSEGKLCGVHSGLDLDGKPRGTPAAAVKAFVEKFRKAPAEKKAEAKKDEPKPRKLVGYVKVCDGQRCYLVPVYEP